LLYVQLNGYILAQERANLEKLDETEVASVVLRMTPARREKLRPTRSLQRLIKQTDASRTEVL
jgi:hypothetical protein